MKKKIYQRHDIPESVVNVVIALCADFPRRNKCLTLNRNVTETAKERYRQFNNAITDALQGIEVGLQKIIFNDIVDNRGYGRSGAQIVISKNAYYRRRRKLIYDIAVLLDLI